MQDRRAKKREEATKGDRVVATNRRARHDYEILETLECGIVLTRLGGQVPARGARPDRRGLRPRRRRTSSGCSRCTSRHGPTRSASAATTPIVGASSWCTATNSSGWQHEIETQSLTIVPLKLYFKDGRAKVELALARGRKQQDRRQALAKRDAEREMARAARHVEKYAEGASGRAAGTLAKRPLRWWRDEGVSGFDIGRRGERSEPWSPEPR